MTAANSSSISDGAAALALMRMSEAMRRGPTPRAVLTGHASHAGPPDRFPPAPVGAIGKLMVKTGWDLRGVDLFEINEAFAVVVMVTLLAAPETHGLRRGVASLCTGGGEATEVAIERLN